MPEAAFVAVLGWILRKMRFGAYVAVVLRLTIVRALR